MLSGQYCANLAQETAIMVAFVYLRRKEMQKMGRIEICIIRKNTFCYVSWLTVCLEDETNTERDRLAGKK